jgi:hypothetical protein
MVARLDGAHGRLGRSRRGCRGLVARPHLGGRSRRCPGKVSVVSLSTGRRSCVALVVVLRLGQHLYSLTTEMTMGVGVRPLRDGSVWGR